MTIRFVPARNHCIFSAVVSAGQAAALAKRPANDNRRFGRDLAAANDDALFKQTLRHFAEHGLSAAERARTKAIAAREAGDEDGYDWWLAVCRKLDRRMADAVPGEACAAETVPLA